MVKLDAYTGAFQVGGQYATIPGLNSGDPPTDEQASLVIPRSVATRRLETPGRTRRVPRRHARRGWFPPRPAELASAPDAIEAMLNLSAQTAACNRPHSIEHRCARWLLMASDRTASSLLPLTQEFLSSMLGVRRAGVTEIAGELQRSGLIRYRHGHITIVDREGLEATACECYQIDRDRFDRLL
jgi:CRP-like cAMP-binding protein